VSSLNEFPNLTNSNIIYLQKIRFVSLFPLINYYKLCYRVSRIESVEQLCLICICSYIFYLFKGTVINPLNAELSPICYLLALLELTIFSTLAG